MLHMAHTQTPPKGQIWADWGTTFLFRGGRSPDISRLFLPGVAGVGVDVNLRRNHTHTHTHRQTATHYPLLLLVLSLPLSEKHKQKSRRPVGLLEKRAVMEWPSGLTQRRWSWLDSRTVHSRLGCAI